MAVDNDPRPVLRQELSRIFKNQRVIRAFEKLFDLIPPEFINQQIQIDALNLISELAASQSTAALASIGDLTAAIDRLAVAPPTELPMPPDDIAPRDELGDLKALTVETGLISATLMDFGGLAVSIGAADSGGVGFRVLRVPN